jgi:hypothetical protein
LRHRVLFAIGAILQGRVRRESSESLDRGTVLASAMSWLFADSNFFGPQPDGCRCDRSQVSRYSKYGVGFATGRRVHRCPRRQQTQFEAGDSDSNSRCRRRGRQVRTSVGLCGVSGFCSETVTTVCRSLSLSHTHGRSCKRRCQRPGQPPGCRAPLGLPRPQLRGPWRGRHSR